MFKIGDKVRLVNKPNAILVSYNNLTIEWLQALDNLVGTEGIVTDFYQNMVPWVKFSNGHHQVIHPDWLEHVIENEEKCTCHIAVLMSAGCKCGQFTREMNEKH